SSRRRHTRFSRDWSSDVCSSDLVFPKFYSSNALDYLEQLAALNELLGVSLYGMPILEGRTIAYRETRTQELSDLRIIIEPFKHRSEERRVGKECRCQS